MNKILRFHDKTDLSLSKDSTSIIVFKRDKRLAVILSIIPIWFFGYHFFYTGKGINLTQEGDVMGFIVSISVILLILFMISMWHQLTFNIPKRTYYEEVGFFPFAMKNRSGSLENLSIELVKEKRGRSNQYSVYVVKIVFPSKRRVGLSLFHELAKAKENFTYISKKLKIKDKKENLE